MRASLHLRRERARAVAVAFLASLFGCDREPLAAGSARGASSWYAGKSVLLAGEVDEVYSNRSFVLGGNKALFGSDVLVLTRSNVTLGGRSLAEDDTLLVSGELRRFVTLEVEQQVGWDLTPDLEREWSDKAVIVASSVSRIDEYARWSNAGDEVVSLAAVHHAPDHESLLGRRVNLQRVQVGERAEKGIWIGPSAASRLFVSVSKAQLARLRKGEIVDVEGQFARVSEPSQQRKNWQLTQLSAAAEESLFIEASRVEKSAVSETVSVDPRN